MAIKFKLLLNLNIDVSDFNLECGHLCQLWSFSTEDKCSIMEKLPEFETLLLQNTKMVLMLQDMPSGMMVKLTIRSLTMKNMVHSLMI